MKSDTLDKVQRSGSTQEKQLKFAGGNNNFVEKLSWAKYKKFYDLSLYRNRVNTNTLLFFQSPGLQIVQLQLNTSNVTQPSTSDQNQKTTSTFYVNVKMPVLLQTADNYSNCFESKYSNLKSAQE